jgi:hypothetical protein
VSLKPGKPGSQLEQVRDALRTAGKGARRSALYHWMHQNHDKLIALFEDTPPAWAVLAEAFGRMGINDREGKNPAPKTVRMTWYRVRLDVTRFRARGVGAGAADLTAAASFMSQTADPALSRATEYFEFDPNVTEEDEPAPEPEFKFATIPSRSSPTARSDVPRTPAGSLRQDPDEVIARLLTRPKRGIIPMPDIPEPEDE